MNLSVNQLTLLIEMMEQNWDRIYNYSDAAPLTLADLAEDADIQEKVALYRLLKAEFARIGGE
jgi:hypothetical protein